MHINYQRGSLEILDQTKLPLEEVFIKINSVTDGYKAIKEMRIRGAPCIAIVGLLSLAVELSNTSKYMNKEAYGVANLKLFLQSACDKLCEARVTAVNLKNECDKLMNKVTLWMSKEITGSELIEKVIDYIEQLPQVDIEENKAIGQVGGEFIINNYLKESDNKKCIILTHCNTGSLATAGYGTALGVIRFLHEKNRLEMAYCTETRPYNQGSRLTAYELTKENIPSKLICDNMAAALMSTKKVTAVIVGADRVTKNGDTANKVGTYSLAILANYHKIPFFVALPIQTFDATKKSGESIVIEERPAEELKIFAGQFIAPKSMDCWNPAFDITPSKLITGYITKYGVLTADEFYVQIEYRHLLEKSREEI